LLESFWKGHRNSRLKNAYYTLNGRFEGERKRAGFMPAARLSSGIHMVRLETPTEQIGKALVALPQTGQQHVHPVKEQMKSDFGMSVEKMLQFDRIDDGQLARHDGFDGSAMRFVIEKAGKRKLFAFRQFAQSGTHMLRLRNFNVGANRDFAVQYDINFLASGAFRKDEPIGIVILSIPEFAFHEFGVLKEKLERTGV
jgi:hypothetical protein